MMEHLRKIIRKKLFELYENDSIENVSKPGEYSTEEMESFLFKLINLVPFGDKNYGNGPNITIPSSWPASSISYTKESIIENWEESKQNHSGENTKWYVWKVNIGNIKPVDLSTQRMDLNSILSLVSKYPESFRNISIGVEIENTEIN